MAVTDIPDVFISDVEWHPKKHRARKEVFIIILKLSKTNSVKGGGGEKKIKEMFLKILTYRSWSEFLTL